MATRHTRLAKLTRPRLHAPVARERLFRRLDLLRAQPVVWITGPPGAGKTTLVASYLDAARLGAIWMQLDAADSDPAAFFLYLRQAIGALEERRARPLPLLTVEYLADLPGFARRFFRDAFARLPSQTPVVLDNYHELAPDSALHEALAAALQEIPPEANLIVASRAEPPSAFAAARLNATIALLGWNDLKLTASEAEGVARDRGVADSALATKLHAQTDGWFAGLALLLEQARSGESTRGAVRADALEIVFDFFAQVIFTPPPTRCGRRCCRYHSFPASPSNFWNRQRWGRKPSSTSRACSAGTSSWSARRTENARTGSTPCFVPSCATARNCSCRRNGDWKS